MPHFVEWDGGHPLQRVTGVRRSQDAGTYAGRGVVLADVDLAAIGGTPRYWRHDAGVIRAMTAAEHHQAVAEDEAAGEAAAREQDKTEVDRRPQRGLVEVLLPVINWVRKQQGQAPVTVRQVTDAIKQRIEEA